MPKRIRLGTVTNGTLDSTDATLEIDGDDLYITVENGDVRTDGTVTFEDSTADPSANGELQRNGADFKAFSGGAVRNLSDIGSGLWEAVTGAIRPDTADTDVIPNGDSSLGTSSDPWPSVTTGRADIGGMLYAEEDDNSPINESGQSSVTYTLAGTYERVYIWPTTAAGNIGPNAIRINGVSATDYETVDDGGTASDNETEVPFGGRLTDLEYICLVDNDFRDEIGVVLSQARGVTNEATVRGSLTGATGDGINQFTLLDTGATNRTFQARVIGRDNSI